MTVLESMQPHLSSRDIVSTWIGSSGTSNTWSEVQYRRTGGYVLAGPPAHLASLRTGLTWFGHAGMSVGAPRVRRILRTDVAQLAIDTDAGSDVKWLDSTLNRLRGIFALDLADHGLSPPSTDIVVDALMFLSEALQADAAPPSFAPLNDGGLQVEWHRGGVDVEVIFSPDPSERGVYVRDKESGEERDLPLSPSAFADAVGSRLNIE